MLPGWRVRRWRRRRVASFFFVLLVVVLAFAVCARRVAIPRAVIPAATPAIIIG